MFINGIIYVGDTALAFPSRSPLIKALPIAHKIMTDLKLENKESKSQKQNACSSLTTSDALPELPT
jgi:hypothetical protein